jgi:hypothetical protein
MNRSGWVTRFGAAALALACASTASAQWTSGSNGSDGALNITAQGVTVFDPVALNLDQDGDNVFHFTTISIAAGATLQLTASKLRMRPVIFLASGGVTIVGTLDLSGAKGYNSAGDISLRGPSEPGPGGYSGGVGGSPNSPARAGAGPGGGAGAGCGASFSVPSHNCTIHTYGTPLLVPLIGGSGGAGGSGLSGGGGAGGGAIRISSQTEILISGTIKADGGGGGAGGNGGGAGSGGAIHLQAPAVSGAGSVTARGTGDNVGRILASPGRIRVDATSNEAIRLTGTVTPAPRYGPLQLMPVPGPLPAIAITRVNGLPVPAAPAGSAEAVDVTIDSAGPVAIEVAARNVKLGTVVKLWISSEVGADQFVDTSELAGTEANSAASVTVTLPAGVSKLLAQAKWQ